MVNEPTDLARASRRARVFRDWAAPDGWRCGGWTGRQPAGASARGSLLFAGGRGDFIEKYLEAFAHWHAAGWNVDRFDWRGQGGSRGDSAAAISTSFDPLVDDLAALIADWRGAGAGPACRGRPFDGRASAAAHARRAAAARSTPRCWSRR